MYQVAIWAIGPILGVRVVHTIGFDKMEVSPVDAADYVVW